MHYYAAVRRDGTGKLLEVIRYNKRSERDDDCKPCNFHDGFHRVKVNSSVAKRLARELFGIMPYERFFGHITYCEPTNYTYYVDASAPAIITHG